MRQIQEAEAPCAKDYDQVSPAWEALMDDMELQDITKRLHMVDTNMDSLQISLKALSQVKNMSKVVDLKELQ